MPDERDAPRYSYAHCTGGDFSEEEWKFRSCHYRNLCWELTPSRHEEHGWAARAVFYQDPATPATDLNISLGAINPRWPRREHERLRFAPIVVKGGLRVAHLRGSEREVLLPYHELNGANVAHLILDDFFPMFEGGDVVGRAGPQSLGIRAVS